MTSLVIFLLIVLVAVAVASEEVMKPKRFSRRAFLPKTESKFHTSSGIAGMDHEQIKEVVATAPKADDASGKFPFIDVILPCVFATQ